MGSEWFDLTREDRLRAPVVETKWSDREYVVAPTAKAHCDTEHQFTRNGLDITVRVIAIEANQGYALVFGDGSHLENCLVRIHSRCLYGDALRSDDCDCGPELDLAMDMIQEEGKGVLIYLEQEGRGAGLINKARAYQYSQQHDADTFESYGKLGLQLDSRRYTAAAMTLNELGLKQIRLLTNNPAKADDLREAGLAVEMKPLLIPPQNPTVHRYLEAKRAQRHHRLPKSWRFYKWVDRMMQATGLLVFGLCCAALALVARSTILTVWERVWPGAAVPAGGFVIIAVGIAATVGLAVGKRGSTRRRLQKARLASRIAFVQLR
ncbi:GTP cyclohydrolase II [Nocardia sp. NPDC059091]|uniref:GTP cyclohydrolase II n=1 Tax=unclassified Nocardia TaxID=2637762 RepID=UPI0036A90F8A